MGGPPRTDLKRGALYMVAAALLFAAMGAAVKAASRELPNAMVVFFRNAVGFLALLPWLLRGGVANLRTHHFPEHVVRGLAGLAAMFCFFYAIAHLRLADAMLLNQSHPTSRRAFPCATLAVLVRISPAPAATPAEGPRLNPQAPLPSLTPRPPARPKRATADPDNCVPGPAQSLGLDCRSRPGSMERLAETGVTPEGPGEAPLAR